MSKTVIAFVCAASLGTPTFAAQWAVDPTQPGPDVPSRGMSLFDAVTIDTRGERHVPFPFERLLQRIEAAAGCTEPEQCTRAVLIPLGRSLQRVAASPTFFAHPRIVVAVTQQRGGELPLRDRLFLGFQEAQGIIEAISYNAAAGRFEFQLIKNYRAGQTPRVLQARRVVCISCHQNHAPIFSRQVWSETNANPHVVERLAEHAQRFSGVAVRGSTEIANAIDESTERANRFAVTQTLWRQGCDDRCRAAASRLASGHVDAGDRTIVAETLERSARTQWPDGLAIPNPDIPNRDPFLQAVGSTGVELTHVPARLEPLAERAPLDVVPPRGDALADELIAGLATLPLEECCGARRSDSIVEPVPETTLTGLAAELEPHCGSCHRTPDAAPPNFLFGTQAQVERQLASCAARIYVRLAMGALEPHERDKTPMPPATTPRDARATQSLARLAVRVRGELPTADALLLNGYERLPPCLP